MARYKDKSTINRSLQEERMNIAVLSDIHGNHIALEACLDYLKDKDIDAYCFLGDYTGEFPGIQQTMKMLYYLREKKQWKRCVEPRISGILDQ